MRPSMHKHTNTRRTDHHRIYQANETNREGEEKTTWLTWRPTCPPWFRRLTENPPALLSPLSADPRVMTMKCWRNCLCCPLMIRIWAEKFLKSLEASKNTVQTERPVLPMPSPRCCPHAGLFTSASTDAAHTLPYCRNLRLTLCHLTIWVIFFSS